MTRSAHALWRPVPYRNLHPRANHHAALIHSNGGGSDHGSLYGWWLAGARGDRGPDNLHVGAQLQIKWDGTAEQYVDLDLVVYHAYSASEWAFGIEVQDDGDPSRPMSDAQLATIVAVLREQHVPGRLLTSPDPADGVGYHEQFPQWNQSGHQCPGRVREHQVRTEIIPALLQKPHHPPAKPSKPPVHVQEDGMYLIQVPGHPEVYGTQFVGVKWHVPDPNVRDDIIRVTGRQVQPVSQETLDSLTTVGGK